MDNKHLFDGFASNAVISIIAVMIIGAGLDKTGVMSKVAAFILKVGGTTETRIIPIISSTVAIISSFMQNVGAAALFLPVVARISARSGLPMSRLLMPMGFCAILGGTVTMVGSSPLILLNDLILTSNKALPAGTQMDTWSLFSVTPVGLALVATGIVYFVVAGRFVLPTGSKGSKSKDNAMTYFRDIYGLDYELFEVEVPEGSELDGKHLDEVEHENKIRVIASASGGTLKHGQGAISRDTGIAEGMVLGIIASPKNLLDFVEKYGLDLHSSIEVFGETFAATKSGVAEVVIPPGSNLVGKSARDVWMRKTFGIAMVALHRDGDDPERGRKYPQHAAQGR